jgi:hypothetical protein
VVVGALPTGSLSSRDRQPSQSDVAHDHIRFGQHQILAITYIGVRLGRHVKHASKTEGGETVGCPSSSSELSPGRGSTEMISGHRSDANGKVLLKCVGESLLPPAESRGLGRPGPPVAAPGTGNSHVNLFCYIVPSQTLVTKLQDLLCRGRVRRSAATHGDAGLAKLLADRAQMNAQLGTDLAEGPTLGV